MAFDVALGELQVNTGSMLDANKILDNLINPKNIDLKTHIQNPILWSIFESIVDNIDALLKKVGQVKLRLPKFKKMLKSLKTKIKRFMISWNRMSRLEITDTLKSIRNEEKASRTFAERLLGLNK